MFQRPQHLMTRCARSHRVFYVEEVMIEDGSPRVEFRTRQNGVEVVVPYLPDLSLGERRAAVPGARIRVLVDAFLAEHDVREYILWYYTPMARMFTRHLKPLAVVYDCMDELSGFSGAPEVLRAYEAELLECADLVTTGGRSLFESRRHRHHNVHPFPSSVDVEHFRRARVSQPPPADQVGIPRPRLGFFGVIDERMDLALIAGLAAARPDWQIVLIGPVAKIDHGFLPRAPNIHYLGKKTYEELPSYLAGWDVALLPFARNEATRFISPTKTPEYLAAGRPVVSTSIADVVEPYGSRGLARIADGIPEFVAAIEDALADHDAQRLQRADAFLATTSWDGTWARMYTLLERVLAGALHDTRAVPEADSGNVA